MAWRCIRFDYNAQWYICIETDVSKWQLLGVVLYHFIPDQPQFVTVISYIN
jgi:hypothetical protein